VVIYTTFDVGSWKKMPLIGRSSHWEQLKVDVNVVEAHGEALTIAKAQPPALCWFGYSCDFWLARTGRATNGRNRADNTTARRPRQTDEVELRMSTRRVRVD
jgi:hypothetical protein